jgi:hypothetical protein
MRTSALLQVPPCRSTVLLSMPFHVCLSLCGSAQQAAQHWSAGLEAHCEGMHMAGTGDGSMRVHRQSSTCWGTRLAQRACRSGCRGCEGGTSHQLSRDPCQLSSSKLQQRGAWMHVAHQRREPLLWRWPAPASWWVAARELKGAPSCRLASRWRLATEQASEAPVPAPNSTSPRRRYMQARRAWRGAPLAPSRNCLWAVTGGTVRESSLTRLCQGS